MSMTDVDPAAMPPEPPPMADPGGVPIGTSRMPSGLDKVAEAAPPIAGTDIGKISGELADIQRQKMAADEPQYRDLQATIATDKARMLKAYEASGIGPDDLKPWDAKGQQEKYRYDPLEAFGSIGSVFAIVAASFTKQPMENAMFGAASAMNAIKEGNKEEYERAYKAWQDNSNLAIKRQNIMHQQYQDAASLMTNNMAAGEAALKVNAARFGDKQALFLLENGMNKELLDLIDKRQDMAIKLTKANNAIALDTYKTNDLLNTGYDPKNPGSPESRQALQTWQQTWKGRKYDEDADFSARWRTENPDGTADEFREAYKKWVEDTSKFRGGSNRQPKPEEEAVRALAGQIKEEAAAKGETISDGDAFIQAQKKYRLETATPTGNQLDKMAGDINQMDNAREAAKNNIDFLESYAGGAGVAGKVRRMSERIGNIFGSNETARVEFEKRVAYMKMVAPRLITMSAGRPLASEAANVGAVIAGLGWGDTTANTIAAMRSFDALMEKMQGDLAARRAGRPNAAGSVPAAKSGSAEPAWKSSPLAAP